MRQIYISSNAFPEKTLDAVFSMSQKLKIDRLELGSGVAYDPDARKKIVTFSKKTKVILHNYIPAPYDSFVLNLASPSKEILRNSTKLVKEALEISAEIKAPIFAVHSGFSYYGDPESLGKKQKHLEHFSFTEAEKIFEESIFKLADYARNLGVKLLIENNVITKQNLQDGENKSYLVADLNNSLYFLKKFESLGVGLLLDTGHLQVSANALKFDKLEYVKGCLKYIGALHISENNFISDQHFPLNSKSWALEVINLLPKRIITVEVVDNLKAALLNVNIINETCH